MVITSFFLKQERRYDAQTFCPNKQLTNHTIIVIDKTDPFTETQKDYIKSYIDRIRNELSLYEKISLFTLSDNNYIAPTAVFSKCNPGTGKEANVIYQNPRMIQSKFDDFFKTPLDNILKNIFQEYSAPISPILEMIREISYREDFSSNVLKRNLIIIADMMQNMPNLYSHYSDIIDYKEFKKDPYFNEITTNLNGIEVQIIYLYRPKANLKQGRKHIFFWEQYFQNMGAHISLVRFIR